MANETTIAAPAPRISVIIPVRDGDAELERCLAALAASAFEDYEVIVVDDGSNDNSAAVAAAAGAHVIKHTPPAGAAAARNRGAAAARGNILFFIDADVEVEPDALAKVAAALSDGSYAAVIGSYGPYTPARGYFSKFKNIHHHYIHQISNETATTFWTGCGAVTRNAFAAVHGFDDDAYAGATIEDIEFGYRLNTAGFKIHLANDIQVNHLKRYNLWSLMRSDIFHRAVPWTRLMLLHRRFRSDLNTTPRNALSVLFATAVVASFLAAPFRPAALAVAIAFLALFTLNTLPFNRYVKKYYRWPFTIVTVLMSVWYFFYAGVGLALGLTAAVYERLAGRRRPE